MSCFSPFNVKVACLTQFQIFHLIHLGFFFVTLSWTWTSQCGLRRFHKHLAEGGGGRGFNFVSSQRFDSHEERVLVHALWMVELERKQNVENFVNNPTTLVQTLYTLNPLKWVAERSLKCYGSHPPMPPRLQPQLTVHTSDDSDVAVPNGSLGHITWPHADVG